ncbi:NAD-dependent ADP-ribosyltransferase [Serratia ficaria]|uniref:scabin-related ADP-ribosyltransferase n=1 Tax=Serratia ficaria TaxID=61651 RepID=UPI00119AEC74|nr:enterotoxin A family protein [Serratia ficaria]CAI1891479.1 NAD-dependent ADP-ribosyltransferase [Serratia ficaria]VVA49797.1 Pertussis toxin subunit 1 precursor [Serratia ficaria]
MKVITLCFFIFFMIFKSQAIELVYRSDQRAPEGIYREGFHALGENDNMLTHVEGESCISGTRDSAFVATTTSYIFAERFSWDVRVGEPFWVYSIRPTNNFYSVFSSLIYAYNHSHNEIFRTTAETFRGQGEYAAFGGIASQQVMGAWLYRSNGRGIPATRLSYVENPDYIDDDTDVNPAPYPSYYLPTGSNSLTSCERCINSTSPSLPLDLNEKSLVDKIIFCKQFYSILLFE